MNPSSIKPIEISLRVKNLITFIVSTNGIVFMKFKILFLALCISLGLQAQHRHQKTNLPHPSFQASNLRSDTVDILKYTINLNITSFVDSSISGNTEIKFTPKLNGVSSVALDLLKLTVDSVKWATSNLMYTYDDTLLLVSLAQPMNIGDTSSMVVYYHGKPQGDASGWGGFYFQNGYAYNLGVGFAAQPHCYGRVWFPCFDNFVERSVYEFNITTNNGKLAYCNGYLANDTTDLSGNRTRKWILDKEIPTYLASVSVAAYAQINQTFNSLTGPKPIVIAALAGDTTNVKNSFINLPSALSTYENRFGPYRWNRVGYCMVPFSSGAMEHATNISYPQAAANGSLLNQTVMAHELSHHWFGDLVTCRTPQDMWLNEGWARYCEFIFTEGLSGYTSYLNDVRLNHENCLQFLEPIEGGFQTLSNMPLSMTYGVIGAPVTSTYDRGADIAHTLRGYMGDSLFFYSLKDYLAQHQYQDVSSADMRDALTNASGINLTDFFNDWVFNPGWPHFSIDSTHAVANGSNYLVTVYLKQKLTGAPNYFNQVPLNITFKAANWAEQIRQVYMSGPNASFQFTLPFNPVFTAVNMDEKISHAVAPAYQTIKTTGSKSFANAKMTIGVTSISDSAFVRVEHNFAAPDAFQHCCMPYRLSPNHYWKVDGILPSNFKATATIFYNGQTTSYSGYNWLDNNLITTYEDSLVLMYRRNAASDWSIYPYYHKNMLGSNNNKYGQIIIDTLHLGEFTFAMKDYLLGVPNTDASANVQVVKLFPNPANDLISVELLTKPANPCTLMVTDVVGKLVYQETITNSKNTTTINTSAFKNGMYFLTLKSTDRIVSKNKFIVSH